EEADRMVEKLQGQNPLPGGLERLAAALAFEKQDYGRAVTLAQKAKLGDSKDYRDHIWLGQLFWAAGQKTEAERALRRAAALAGDAPDAWMALVVYLARTGEKARAEAALLEAEKKLP